MARACCGSRHWEWHGVACYVVVPLEGEPTLVYGMGGTHAEAVRRATAGAINDVRHSRGGRFGEVMVERIRELGLERGRIGLLEIDPRFGDYLPVNQYDVLRSGLPEAELVFTRGLMHELLVVHSPEDIDCIRTAAHLCDRAMEALVERARPGVREYQLRAAATHAVLDGDRVAAAGVSLGGYYAGRAAAFEPRLACAVAMGGPYAFAPDFDELPSLSRQAFEVRSHSPDAETARRRAAALSLEHVAERIRQPFLVVFGKRDRLIPYQHAERLYAEISSADKRLEMYEHGNHVVNNMPYAYRPLVADWVADHLYGGAAPTIRLSVAQGAAR